MSAIEYNNLLFEISQKLDELNVFNRLRFMFRGKLAPGSEDNIQDTLSLFKELEEQNILGADRLVEMKDLLNGVEEWSLLEKVEKFASKRKEYHDLLERIIRALDELDELERLIAICRGKISEESEAQIQDVRSLFKELENKNNLGIHHLDILKRILTEMENNELLKEVEKFEERRKQEVEIKRKKAKAAAFVSSVGNTLTGVLNIKTAFKVVAGGITVVSTMEVLSRWTTFDQLVAAVNSCVLPAGTSLVNLTDGCVCLTVQAETLSALTTLWNLYQDGTLERRLYDFFVTDEVKERAGGETVEVNVTIEEEEYDKARLELMNEAQGREVAEMKEKTDKPEMSQGPKAKFMDIGKFAFVQKYLEDVQDTRSMTTEASDSGLATHTAASELGTEEINETEKLCLKDLSRDVKEQLTQRLQVDRSAMKKFYQFFGLKMGDRDTSAGLGIADVKELFPDTTVTMLKECFEALRLYDLAEILEKVRPRSLRPAVSPEQIEKLQKEDDRPTKYHSNVAVLVVNHSVDEDIVERDDPEKIEIFFKDLNSRNEVATISLASSQETRQVLREMRKRKRKKKWLLQHEESIRVSFENTLQEQARLEKELEEVMQMENGREQREGRLRKNLSEVKQETLWLRSELEDVAKERQLADRNIEKLKELEKETEKSISTAMDEWIHNQEKFICVAAVFIISDDELYTEAVLEECIVEKLALIPDHAKLVVSHYELKSIAKVPETLHVMFPAHGVFTRMMEIFNKRWQTLDLISMIQELKRTTAYSMRNLWHPFPGPSISIMDSLSTLPIFKKKEEEHPL